MGAVFSDNTERQKSTLAKRHSLGSRAALTTMASKAARDTKVPQRRDEFALPMQFESDKLGFQSPNFKFQLNLRMVVKDTDSRQRRWDPVSEVEEAVEEEESGDRRTSGGQFTKPKHFILILHLKNLSPMCSFFTFSQTPMIH